MSCRAPLFPVLLLSLSLVTGCAQGRGTRPPHVPTAGAAGSAVHASFRDHDIVEIAVKVPVGDFDPSFRIGMRAGLYAESLERSYSPLDPRYVDRMETDLASVTGPSHLTSAVTAMKRESIGRDTAANAAAGWLVSGWAALTAPTPEGGEVVYTMELVDYFVAVEPEFEDVLLHGDEAAQRNALEAAGRRFGRALLTQLPRR